MCVRVCVMVGVYLCVCNFILHFESSHLEGCQQFVETPFSRRMVLGRRPAAALRLLCEPYHLLAVVHYSYHVVCEVRHAGTVREVSVLCIIVILSLSCL